MILTESTRIKIALPVLICNCGSLPSPACLHKKQLCRSKSIKQCFSEITMMLPYCSTIHSSCECAEAMTEVVT